MLSRDGRHKNGSFRRRISCAAVLPYALLLTAVTLIATASTPCHAENVVVLLSANAPAYRDAVKGFEKSTHHKVIATYDLKGERDPGAAKKVFEKILTEDKPDLIYAVGIYALRAAVQTKTSTPVVYSMVLNPPSILAANQDNITGASMNVSPEQTLQTLKSLIPGLQRVGTIYANDTTGFLIREAQQAAEKLGITLLAKPIDGPGDAIKAINEFKDAKLDALWLVPDNACLAPRVVERLLDVSYRLKVPVVGISKSQAQLGTTLSLCFASSEDIGQQAGELANLILSGKDAASVPFTMARKTSLVVNLRAAKKMGISVPESIIAQADEVIR